MTKVNQAGKQKPAGKGKEDFMKLFFAEIGNFQKHKRKGDQAQARFNFLESRVQVFRINKADAQNE